MICTCGHKARDHAEFGPCMIAQCGCRVGRIDLLLPKQDLPLTNGWASQDELGDTAPRREPTIQRGPIYDAGSVRRGTVLQRAAAKRSAFKHTREYRDEENRRALIALHRLTHDENSP